MDLNDALCNFLDREGKLVAYPAKRKMKLYALAYYAGQFEAGKRYTETQVNDLIDSVSRFRDHATIRRELYNCRFLDRERDGSAYWLEEPQPQLELPGEGKMANPQKSSKETSFNNKYDDPVFFEKYSQMSRSQLGLDGAGEWRTLQPLLPDFTGKRVLDLGCGYGWHCIYAMEHGAASVTGIDISQKMLEVAKKKTTFPQVQYRCMPIEKMDFAPESFDIVLSSLAFHYIRSFEEIARKVNACLAPGGYFVFSVEHPVFTAYGTQDWYYGNDGKILHFPVDNYYYEGERRAVFLGEEVTKYHKTLTTYLNGLLTNGFELRNVVEPQPPAEMMGLEGMKDEMRRPMMLVVVAVKK